MAIDATEVLGIDLTGTVWATNIMWREYVRRVGLQQTRMSVCFYQDPTSLTTPFVSSIEMRWLEPLAYDQPWIDKGNFLLSALRQDFGGVTMLRYPDDAYDRLWRPSTIPGTKTVSTKETISDIRILAIKPPQAVMQTAITPTNLSNLVLPYALGTAATHLQSVYYLYLAEISATATATSRAFTVNIPHDIYVINYPVNIYTMSGGINKALELYWTDMTLTDTSAVTLKLNDPPTVDVPLVSGAELLYKFPELTLPSNADDAAALETIKVALSLTSWSGDPCLPVPYDWITCSAGTSPRVLTVKLNGYNLTGLIPDAFAQLTSLRSFIRGNPLGISSSSPPSPKPKPSNTGVVAGVVGGILGVVVVGALLFVFCCNWKRNKATANGSVQRAKPYSFAELTTATQNFSRKIGEGGFGPVYYGKLEGREVAVKVSDANSRQGVNEFNNEVQLLSRVHHKNLVSLVGYCLESKHQMLVYEFLHRGTVREHLCGSPLAHREPLDRKMQLDIAVNSAQGLKYLHGGCTPNIIHRVLKNSNILLTDKYVAKVADFGISRLGPKTGQASYVSTEVKRTFGYLDPEYWSTNNLTEKSDVFSFGVVLLELLCGRQPIDNSLQDESEWNLSEKVRNSLQAGNIETILDPVVKSCHPNMDSVWKLAEVAIQSVEPKGVHRPFMRDVIRDLREAIALEAGLSHALYSSDQSSNFVNTTRPALRGQDYSNVADSSINILEYSMPKAVETVGFRRARILDIS